MRGTTLRGSRLLARLPLRVIDRYLMRQFLLSYLICAGAILGLFMLIEGVSRLDHFFKEDKPLVLVLFHYFAAVLPIYFSQFLAPVFTLMGAMFSITLLNRGNELVPLKLSGLSMQRILAPYFLLACCFMGLMIFVQEVLLPNFKDEIRTAYYYGKRKSALSPIKPGIFPDPSGKLIAWESYFPHEKRLVRINIDEFDGNGDLKSRTVAKELVFREVEGGDARWVLIDGERQSWDAEKRAIPIPSGDALAPPRFTEPFQEEYLTNVAMQPIDVEASDRELPYLSYRELRDQHKRRPYLNHLPVKLHMRFAFPLANIVLLLLGLPFVLRGDRRSVLLGVVAAIVISAAYLFTTVVCTELGNKGGLSPVLAAWLPVLLFGALGLTLFSDLDSGDR